MGIRCVPDPEPMWDGRSRQRARCDAASGNGAGGHADVSILADAVCAIDGLGFDGGVPPGPSSAKTQSAAVRLRHVQRIRQRASPASAHRSDESALRSSSRCGPAPPSNFANASLATGHWGIERSWTAQFPTRRRARGARGNSIRLRPTNSPSVPSDRGVWDAGPRPPGFR